MLVRSVIGDENANLPASLVREINTLLSKCEAICDADPEMRAGSLLFLAGIFPLLTLLCVEKIKRESIPERQGRCKEGVPRTDLAASLAQKTLDPRDGHFTTVLPGGRAPRMVLSPPAAVGGIYRPIF